MAKQKVALQPNAEHPPMQVYFANEPYLHGYELDEETRFPTGEARLNSSNDVLQCRNDASHLIKRGEYYTVEIDEPVCFKCRSFKLGVPKHRRGNLLGLAR